MTDLPTNGRMKEPSTNVFAEAATSLISAFSDKPAVRVRGTWGHNVLMTTKRHICEQNGAQNIDDQLEPGIQLLGSFAISREEDSNAVDRRMLIRCPAGDCYINKEHYCSSDTTSCCTGSPSFAVPLPPRCFSSKWNSVTWYLFTLYTPSLSK